MRALSQSGETGSVIDRYAPAPATFRLNQPLESADSSQAAEAPNDLPQTSFYIFMLTVTLCLVSLVLFRATASHTGLTYQAVFAIGAFVAAVDFVACLWNRRPLIFGTAIVLAGMGVGALLTMTVWPNPDMEPILRDSGAWTHGPLPLAKGWWDIAMALGLIFCAAGSAMSLVDEAIAKPIGLTMQRAGIWGASFWQLCYMGLHGQFLNLFASPATISIQCLIVGACLAALIVLLRGDRGWIRTLTRHDKRFPLSNFIFPVAILPTIVGLCVNAGLELNPTNGVTFSLIMIEISSAVIAIAGTLALRTSWRRRHASDVIQDALQCVPAIVMNEHGFIEHWPTECFEIFGFTAEQAIGRHAPTLLRTRYNEPHDKIVATMASEAFWSGEVSQLARDGRQLRILVRLAFHRSQGDGKTRVVATLADITGLRSGQFDWSGTLSDGPI